MADELTFKTKLEELKELNDYIEQEVVKRIRTVEEPRYSSSSINELAKSLSAAQGEFPAIPYNRTSATWNDDYSDLDIVMRHIRPILAKYELALNQWTEITDSGGTLLHTEVLHSSGQWKGSIIRVIPLRNDLMTFDSTMADLRRQQALSMLGVTLEGDPKDDDGDAASDAIFDEIAVPLQKKLVRKKESYDAITKEQLDELESELNGFPDIAEELMNAYNINSLDAMPKSKFSHAITQVRKFVLHARGERKSVR